MRDKELLQQLERMRPAGDQTCWGCGYEHDCKDKGCALVQQAVRRLWECKGQIKHLRQSLKRANQKLDAMQKTIERLREQVDGDSLPPEDVAEILARGCDDW